MFQILYEMGKFFFHLRRRLRKSLFVYFVEHRDLLGFLGEKEEDEEKDEEEDEEEERALWSQTEKNTDKIAI